eukprot:scaffold88501_cov55-Phaeocystis_antarctica.AAC.2
MQIQFTAHRAGSREINTTQEQTKRSCISPPPGLHCSCTSSHVGSPASDAPHGAGGGSHMGGASSSPPREVR